MAKKHHSPHPAWATKFRTPGTELRLIRGKYYLYEYQTVYDREKKKPKKVSGKMIGTITEKDGLIPSGKRQLESAVGMTEVKSVHCKEYGMSYLVAERFMEYRKALEESLGDLCPEILAIAYCRFIYRCP